MLFDEAIHRIILRSDKNASVAVAMALNHSHKLLLDYPFLCCLVEDGYLSEQRLE